MPVQDVRVIEMPARGEAQGDVRGDAQLEVREAPRPAAVDAVRWGTTLMTLVGLDPRTRSPKRTAA
jgi:hypothetical protein